MKKRTLTALLIISVIMGGINTETIAHSVHDEHSELFETVAVKDGTDLNVANCVALAFKNSPYIKRKKYELDLAKSNVGRAKSAFFPVIGAGVGFHNENNSNSRAFSSHYREFPNVAVTVNQLVWDFGKSTANIKMEEFYKIGAEYEFMDSLCSTLFNVKEKYYELLRTQALVTIAEDNVKICKKYLDNAKGIPDKAAAKVYLGRALYERSCAQTVYNNAKVDLSNAMYVDNTPNYNITNTKTFAYNHDYGYTEQKIPPKFTPYNFNIERDKAVEIAYANSPDLKVLESTKSAMEQSLKFIKRTYFPELSAGVGYGYNNSTEASNNNFTVGVNLSSSVNLMELKHSIKGADAQLKIADNEINLFKKDLYFEIQRAFNNVSYAADDIYCTQEAATRALENINTAEKLYQSGTVNYVALQEARKDYINAMLDYIRSLHFYNQSLIQTEEAMHYHMVDIHHKTQHAMTEHFDELIEHLNEALGCEENEPKRKKRTKKNSL